MFARQLILRGKHRRASVKSYMITKCKKKTSSFTKKHDLLGCLSLAYPMGGKFKGNTSLGQSLPRPYTPLCFMCDVM